MNCPFPRESLVALAQGTPQEAPEAFRHVASCPACARELGGLKKTLKAVREAPVARPSAEFTLRVLEEAGRIRSAEIQADAASPLLNARPWWGLARPWAATAAAAALMTSVSTGFWLALLEGPRPERAFPSTPSPVVEGSRPTPPSGGPGLPQPSPEPSRLPLPPVLPDLPVEPGVQEPSGLLPQVPPAIPDPPAVADLSPALLPPSGMERVETPLLPPHRTDPLAPPVKSLPPLHASRMALLCQQNPDGSFGLPVEEETLASRIEVTAFAAMAFGDDPTCTTPVDQVLRFLESQLDRKGWLGPSCDKRVLVQALGTAALASLAPRHPQARPLLDKAASALLQARGPEGWTRDGSPGVHAMATAWAVYALHQAQSAGVRLPAGWAIKPAEGCWRLVDRRKGTAVLERNGEQGGWPAAVAAGTILAYGGRAQDARILAEAARHGLLTSLAAGQEPDLEAMALILLWMREDPKAFLLLGGAGGAGKEALRSCLLRSARPSARGGIVWEAATPSPWDGLEGKPYACAAGAWILSLLEAK